MAFLHFHLHKPFIFNYLQSYKNEANIGFFGEN